MQLLFKNSLSLQKNPRFLLQVNQKEYSPTFRNIMSQVCSKILKQRWRNKLNKPYKGQLPRLVNTNRFQTLTDNKKSQKRCYSQRISTLIAQTKYKSLTLQPNSVIIQNVPKKKQNKSKPPCNKTKELPIINSLNSSNLETFLQQSFELGSQQKDNSESSPISLKNIKKYKFTFKQKLQLHKKSPQQNKTAINKQLSIVSWQPWSTSEQTTQQT